MSNEFRQLYTDKSKSTKFYPNAFLKRIWTDKLHNLKNMINDDDGTKLTLGNSTEYTDIQFSTSGKNGTAKLSELALNSDLTNYATKTELNTKPTIISRDYTGNDISGFFSNFSTNLVTLTNGTYLISGVWASHDHYYGEFKKVDSFVWATIHIATYGVYMMEYKVGQYRYIYQLNTTRVE